MKKLFNRLMVVLVLGLFIFSAGCAVTTDANGQKHYSLNRKVSDKLEDGAEAGIALGPFFGPIGSGVAVALGAALGYWRRVRPKLTEAKTLAEQSHAATAAVVEGLEQVKQEHPDLWENIGSYIKDKIADQNVDPLVIENIIRAIRKLPPKTEEDV